MNMTIKVTKFKGKTMKDRILYLKRKLRSRNAFTMIEMMISLALSSVLIIAISSSYILQKKNYESEVGLLEVQMNADLAMNRIAEVVINAGVGAENAFDTTPSPYLNIPATSMNIANGSTVTRVFTITNGDSNAPDQLTVVTGLRSLALVTNYQDDGVSPFTITLSTMSDFHGDPIFDLSFKQYVFFAPREGNFFIPVSTVDFDSNELTLARNTLDYEINLNSDVFRVNAYTISLDHNGDVPLDIDGDGDAGEEEPDETPLGPDLYLFDNTVDLSATGISANQYEIAKGIETIQFQYGWDADNDGVIEDTEFLDSPTAAQENDIRAVRVFILARSRLPEPDYFDRNTSYTIADQTITLDTDDENGMDSPFDQHYRRQMVTRIIMIRNRNL